MSYEGMVSDSPDLISFAEDGGVPVGNLVDFTPPPVRRTPRLSERVALAWRNSLGPLAWHLMLWSYRVLRVVVLACCLLIRYWRTTLVGSLLLFWIYLLLTCYRTVRAVVDWFIPSPAPPIAVEGRFSFDSPPAWVNHPLLCVVLFQTLAIIYLIIKPGKVIRMCEHGFKVEGVRASSELVNTPSPDYIGEVWIRHSRFTPAKREGTIFRVGAYLYSASHIFEGAVAAWIKYKGQFKELDLSRPVFMDTDVRRFQYEPVSSLQMGAGKFSRTFSPQLVNIHNGSQSSLGKVTRHETIGIIEYDGSTLPSFSGSPYYLGRVVFGLHVGSGVLNLGVDGSLLHHLSNVIKPESEGFTTDYEELLNQEFARSKGEVKFRRTANDYYLVSMEGKWYTYDEEEFEKAQDKWNSEGRSLMRTRYPKYQGEGVTASQVAQLGIKLPEALAPGPVGGKPDASLEPVPVAQFTIQDSENCRWPAASVTQPAGPLKEQVAELVNETELSQPETASPSMKKQPEPMVGPRRLAARQKVLSAITYEHLKAWLDLTQKLESDGISPSKAEMDILRELWFGQYQQTSEPPQPLPC